MVGFELCSSLIRLRASSKISSSGPTGVHGLRSGLTSKSGSRPLPIGGNLPPGTTVRGYCGSSNPSGTFPDCARLKNRRMVQGSSVTPRCPSSAAIAGHVALSFRNRLISFRYGQSWLWNGFGCDVGFMAKASCRHAPAVRWAPPGFWPQGRNEGKTPRQKGDSQCPALRILSVRPDGNSGWNALTAHRDSLPTLRVDLPSREV
jgi:hypothetical protein